MPDPAGERARPWACETGAPDPERMLRLQGYRPGRPVRAPIRAAAGAAAAIAATLAETRGAWRLLAIRSLSAGVLRLEGGARLTCPAFDRLLAGASAVALFAVTIGEGLEREAARRSAGDPLLSLFLETAGRLMLEAALRSLGRDLGAALAGGGRVIGRRMGPGYGYRVQAHAPGRADWPLEEQQAVFAALGPQGLPVELNESGAMKPRFSRSGLLGVHPAV